MNLDISHLLRVGAQLRKGSTCCVVLVIFAYGIPSMGGAVALVFRVHAERHPISVVAAEVSVLLIYSAFIFWVRSRLERAYRWAWTVVTVLSAAALCAAFLALIWFGYFVLTLTVVTEWGVVPARFARPAMFAALAAFWLFCATVVGGLAWLVVLIVRAASAAFRLQHERDIAGVPAAACFQRPMRRPPLSRSVTRVSLGLLLLGTPLAAIVVLLATGPDVRGPLGHVTGIAAGGLFVLTVFVCWPLARRLWQLRAGETLERDRRPPVLLLRSFTDDARRVDETLTFEQALTRELWSRGPVIAIGRPRDKLRPLGAARAYYTRDTWQANATSLMQEADSIVLVIGTTYGLAWEIDRLVELQLLEKVILVFPPDNPAESTARFGSFVEKLAETLGATGLEAVLLALLKQPVSEEDMMVALFSKSEEMMTIGARPRSYQGYGLALALAYHLLDNGGHNDF